MTSDDGMRAEVQARMARLAASLAERLDAMDVAALMIGPGITLLGGAIGRDGAVAYLRDLANQLEAGAAAEPPVVN